MQRSLLPIALLIALIAPAVAVPAVAGETVQSASVWTAETVEEPAVVVQGHQAYLTVKGQAVRGTISWTIEVADPDRATDVATPPGLNGAKTRGAEIVEGRLVLPPGLPAKSVLTFEADIRSSEDLFSPSGQFRTAPGLPTARAELVVRSVQGPLAVWADPSGAPTWTRGKSPQAIVVWQDLPADAVAEAVWSTDADWLSAGARLDKTVQARLTERLGRDLGRDLNTSTPASLTQRVFEHVKLVEGGDRWNGRTASAVIGSGQGTAAERGLVLISALRKAGYEARPGLYRPSSLPGIVPTSVSAPSLLDRPVVAVAQDAGWVWIDPSATFVVPPTLPVDLTGAVAWVVGDLPRRLESTGATEGSVPISGEIKLEQGGGQNIIVNITATGTADEWLRTRLTRMSEAERTTAFRSMVTSSRPEVDRMTVTVTGEEDRSKPLRITVRAHTGPRLQAVSPGIVRERAAPVIAAAMAAWMPAKIAVHEEISMSPPPGLRLFAVSKRGAPSDPGAVVSTSVRREAERIVVITDVERPERHLPPAAASRAAASLARAHTAGPEVLYFAAATPKTAKGLRAANLDVAERITLEAMMLWRMSKYGKARKLLDKYVGAVSLGDLDAALMAYQAPYDLRRTLVDLPRNNRDKLASLPILVASDRHRDAWLRAVEIIDSKEAEVQVQSRLWVIRLQPEHPPGGAEDPQGALLWRDPADLLKEADRIARDGNGGEPDPGVLAAQAKRTMEDGDPAGAAELLRMATALSSDPALLVAQAHAQAAAGAPMDDVLALLDKAVARAPSDGALLSDVANTFASTGHRVDALNRALGAARVSGGQASVWAGVVDRAIEAGELPTALYAARRASDLALSSVEHASVLTRMATLAGDPDQANLGWTRGGTPLQVSWPPAIQELTALVEPPHLLAVLRHHDVQVTNDAGLLSLRAQLEQASGDRSRAVRDGTLLAHLHSMPRGQVVAFGAALGDTWTSQDTRTLDRLVRLDPAARATRLELRALFGGSVAADLKEMEDDPRAQLWRLAQTDPAALAQRDPSWKNPAETWGSPPAGYLVNPVLGSVEGVGAWSAPDSRRTVLRHGASSPLPPPLSVLYTAQNPPIRSLRDGGKILTLSDGSFPVYAAARREQQSWVVGLGLSPDEAARALEAAPPL